jgi:hypothetical protein
VLILSLNEGFVELGNGSGQDRVATLGIVDF